MTFDGIVIYTIIKELNNIINGGKIEKIMVPNATDIFFNIYAKNKYTLLISLNPNSARIHLVKKVPTSKPVPPSFCMVLRKHLQGARIINIFQYNLDRVIKIDFEVYSEMKDKVTKSLIIELMGKYSNCILISNEGYIIDSLRRIDASVSSVRLVLPGLKYCLPQSKRNFNDTLKEEYINLLKNEELKEIEIGKYLINMYNGFTNQFLTSIGINIDELIKYCDIAKTYDYIKNALEKIDENKIGFKDVFSKKAYIDFDNIINDFSINEQVNNHYEYMQNDIEFKNGALELMKPINLAISKCKKNLKIVYNNLEECSKMEDYRIYGEILTANLYKIKEKQQTVILENFYNNNSPIDIPMDVTISPQKNAQKYFKKYAKLKTAYIYSIKQKEVLEAENMYLESIILSLNEAKNLSDLQEIKQELINQKYIKEQKKNSTMSKVIMKENLLKYEYLGYTIYVGKNNLQNEYISHKLATNNDLWFHVKNVPGSHVLIKNAKNPTDNLIKYAAQLAAYYSKARLDTLIEVDYCNPCFIKRHPNKKTGMVIYTDFSTINVELGKWDGSLFPII